MVSTPVIQAKGIEKKFPGVYALKGVDFDLLPGEVHSLVGENGAGKSTLIKILAGAYSIDGGNYLIEGKPANLTSPLDGLDKGISVIYQELNLIPSISIAENIFLGNLPLTGSKRIMWKKLFADTEKILERLGLNVDPSTKVGSLSVAQQQLVEVGRSLSRDAKVIIMDEPTSALSPVETEKLFEVIMDLKKQGVGIIYVSHKFEDIFTLSDRVTVFRDGQYVDTMSITDLTEEQLIAMMVGRKLTSMFPERVAKIGETLLKVENLTNYKLKDISFEARRGEILGFWGLMGSGKTELAKAIIGADKRLQGKIELEGQLVQANSTGQASKMGFGMVPESRKDDGIFANLCVRKNMTISSLPQVSKYGFINNESEDNSVEKMVNALKIKTPSISQLIAKLSGGNQQKVILSRWLIKDGLKVLLIDEPTRGIDVGAKTEVYNILNELANQGLIVIVFSSELPEVLGICDRTYVLRDGTISAEFTNDEATQEKLLASAVA